MVAVVMRVAVATMVTAVIIVPAVGAFVIISLSQQVDNTDHTGGNGCIFHGSDRKVN